jgi:hypothetical protein
MWARGCIRDAPMPQMHLGLHRGGGTCPSFCASFGTPIDPCRVESMMRRCCGRSWLESPMKQARAARWDHQRTSRGSVEGLLPSPPPRQYLTACQENCQAQCSLLHSVLLLELSVVGLFRAIDGGHTVQGSPSVRHTV